MLGAERIRYTTIDGLDACGKSSILSQLREKNEVTIVCTPPKSWASLRGTADNMDLGPRFLFYSAGNLATDNTVRRLLTYNSDVIIVQDRSWLTTLAAHQVRGLSTDCLSLGVYLAQKSVRPDLALIVHVNEEERRQRLFKRGHVTETDRQNLQFADKMEKCYQDWAKLLGWSSFCFDNTTQEIEQAVSEIAKVIGLK